MKKVKEHDFASFSSIGKLIWILKENAYDLQHSRKNWYQEIHSSNVEMQEIKKHTYDTCTFPGGQS